MTTTTQEPLTDRGLMHRWPLELTVRLDKHGNDQTSVLRVVNSWRASIVNTKHTDHRFVWWTIKCEGSDAQCVKVVNQLEKWRI